MSTVNLGELSLFYRKAGSGPPLLVMHGGPGADHTTMRTLLRLKDQFTVILYDHRCNGRSIGADLSSITWENLTADAEALRMALGFERWAVLGHSFGGFVALEYALRFPERISHLVLLDTCGDIRWAHEKAPQTLAERGYPAETVAAAKRFLNGEFPPEEMLSYLMKLGGAYNPHSGAWQSLRQALSWPLPKLRPEALIYCAKALLQDWNVMDRLGEIIPPTLVIAGRDDFQFPPEHQKQLAAEIPGAQLILIERAGHNPHIEQQAVTLQAILPFLED